MKTTARHFSAGPLTFRFDEETGFVRQIRFRGREILRGIYPAVRDRDWATLEANAQPLRVSATPDHVRLEFEGRVRGEEMDLTWSAEIEARANGRLSYRWRGKPGRKSTTNRAGLCVLHPAELAGAPCVVEHTDGTREAGWFPREISPHQPFRQIRALTHVAGERLEAAVRMEGDVFEMEDQRNWTDASFKTYGRPLDWPRPYALEAGVEIEHSITLEIRGDWPSSEPGRAPVDSGSEAVPAKLPRIGFTLPGPVPAALRERVRALRPAHVRVEATPETLSAVLEWAWAEAEFLDCTLLVALRGAEARVVERSDLPARSIVHLFDANGNSASGETMAAWLRAGHTAIATGTLHHFAELNRERPPADGAHAATVFGMNAQVHAGDDDSILETLDQHGPLARAAHRIGAARPVAVAPISLGRRADSADSRLLTRFGAQWLWGSLERLAGAGCVESVTYFYTHGRAGFLREDRVTPVERLLLALAGRDTLPPEFHFPT